MAMLIIIKFRYDSSGDLRQINVEANGEIESNFPTIN
jgi:hypothetical protein